MSDRRTAGALFVLVLVPYVYFYGGWGANQEANYALARAMVEARTFAIESFTGATVDVSTGLGGHTYANKAPGFSGLVALPYFVQFLAQEARLVDLNASRGASRRFTTVAVSGLCGAAIACALFLYGRRTLGLPAADAVLAALGVAFGTIVFTYSTMLFAHVASAFFLLCAFTNLRSRPLIAGLCAGLAGACFFLTVLGSVALVALAATYSLRHAVRFAAGGLPAALALAAYQWVCFGSPFLTPVEQSSAFTEKGLLLGVFGVSHFAARMRWLVFSEYRGLLYSSPVLLLAVVGAIVMLRRRRFVAELMTIAGIAFLFLCANASFNGWHGGAAFGPRYLLPIVPLLAIPAMFAGPRARPLMIVLIALGAFINVAATAVDPMPMDGIQKPFTGYILPTLLGRPVSENTRLHICPDRSAAACTDRRVALWQQSGNAGELLLGAGRTATVWPAVLWMAAGGWYLVSRAGRRTAAGALRSQLAGAASVHDDEGSRGLRGTPGER